MRNARSSTFHAATLGLSFCAFAAPAGAESPVRFFPVAAFEMQGDSIQSGVRVTRSFDGAVRVAKERFDAGGAARGVPVPSVLGGGYLFFQPLGASGGAGTALFRAPEWTGALEPLATVPFVVSELRAGFDRLYLLGAGRAIAIDAQTGTYLPLDPLPPVAAILDLRFDPAGHASLRAPIVGTLVTSDAGLGWRRGGEDTQEESPHAQDEFLGPPPLPRQGQLVQNVVVRGGTLPDGVVVALVEGARVSFAPDRGMLVRVPEADLDPRARCQALPPGQLVKGATAAPPPAPLWFDCRSDAGDLELLAYGLAPNQGSKSPQQMTRLRREVFPAHTRVLGAGRLGVLLDVPCTALAQAAKAGERQLCLVTRSGRKALQAPAPAGQETFAVGAASVHRVSLLKDGGISSERLDTVGERSVHRIHHETEIESLVFDGTWLAGASVFEEGISFWATRGESYVGVRLERDGTSARVGAIQRPLRRASFSGSHALAWGASGFARMSRDGGMTFAEIDYPFVSGDQDPNGLVSPEQALELGCGPAGCALGTWVSVGWGPNSETSLPPTPPRVHVPPLGGGRFRFACSAAVETSAPSLPARERAPGADESAAGAEFVPAFWDRAPPRLEPFEVGHSVGDHRGLARVYALGPRDGAWGSRGRVLVTFRSPFSARNNSESLWTNELFADGADAQTLLGTIDRTTQAAYTELDPGGEGGVLLVRTRQQTTLFSFAQRAHVKRFDVPESFGIGTLSGAVLSRGTWLVGSIAGGEFRIVELAADGPKVLAAFPLGETGPREAILTRSTAGDLGIAIDGDSGLLVYPVSRRGELGDALFQGFRGSRPAQCPAEAAGYLVVRELGISPYVEAHDSELDVSRVTMRRLVGFGPECIDAVAADARGALAPALFRAGAARPGGTPLVITDRAETGLRVRLSCQ